ncbi:hypothetical protein CGZ98_07085 [Enemella evansiae]|uniref:hypothetical protein n=1 Tax=Enemella evansiae TaxID=2016499 RepID=UPI000B96FE2C|nr:hypothetical protein [Enemella evansiae]OYO11953.1 hypothetical protein CGZ98_07085 [Enemella evansiae]
MRTEEHSELFNRAVEVRRRMADRYEAIRGRRNWITIALWIVLGMGGAWVLARSTAHVVDFVAGFLALMASVLGIVFTLPLVLSSRTVDQWRRFCDWARPFGWCLIVLLLIGLAAFQCLIQVQAPAGIERLKWHLAVLFLQVLLAGITQTGHSGLAIVSTRVRDGVMWQRRNARLWLLAQFMVLEGVVLTLWDTEAWSIGTAGVVVALGLFVVTSHRSRMQQIATAREELVASLTGLQVGFDRSEDRVSGDHLADPLRLLQNLCNEDVSNPRTAFFGRTYVDDDLALIVNYVTNRLLGGRQSPRQRGYAQYFRRGAGELTALDALGAEELASDLRDLTDELRHRLHHPIAEKKSTSDAFFNVPTNRMWDAWQRD